MVKIIVNTMDGNVEMAGECLKSELQWSKNVEERIHLQNGVYTTKQVPTDYYLEE